MCDILSVAHTQGHYFYQLLNILIHQTNFNNPDKMMSTEAEIKASYFSRNCLSLMCCPHVLYICEQVLEAGATCVKHQGWASYLIGSRAGASRIWDGQKPDTAMTQDGNSLEQYAKSQE